MTDNIDYNSYIYLQLREVIRNKIEEGQYPLGTAIPSENTLAETYGVNRLTVRYAMDELVKEGLLKRVQGKGVYVQYPIQRELDTLGGFTQTMLDRNIVPRKKILKREKRIAGSKLARIFGISREEEVYYIKRLDYGNEEPISIEEIFIPYNLIPKVEGIDVSVFSMYEIYKFYDIVPARACQSLDLAHLTQSDARYLELTKDDTVFIFSSITYDVKEKVIEYAKSYTRGDKCNFTVHFHK